MVRIGSIGINLQDETKEVSTENKVLSFHLFGQCPKCKSEIELVECFVVELVTLCGLE